MGSVFVDITAEAKVTQNWRNMPTLELSESRRGFVVDGLVSLPDLQFGWRCSVSQLPGVMAAQSLQLILQQILLPRGIPISHPLPPAGCIQWWLAWWLKDLGLLPQLEAILKDQAGSKAASGLIQNFSLLCHGSTSLCPILLPSLLYQCWSWEQSPINFYTQTHLREGS